MVKRLKLSGIALALAFAMVAVSPLAVTKAVTGDRLREFDPAGMTCPYGSSVAFDGTTLYSSCWDSNVLYHISPVDGSSLGSGVVTGIFEIGAMAWDGGRNKLWICGDNHLIYTVDPTTLAKTLMFDSVVIGINQGSCRDGLAYDPQDDTVWLSGDGDLYVYHLTSSGTLLGTFDPLAAGGINDVSGLAVNGTMLYVANPISGEISTCTKTFTSCSVVIANAVPSPSHPTIEDLECDEVTFAPKHALWVESQGNPYLVAWEVPSCVGAGGPPVPPCTPPTALNISTGIGSSAGSGIADSIWTVTSAPGGVPTPAAYPIISYPGWVAAPAGTNWLDPDNSGAFPNTDPVSPPPYVYQTAFRVPSGVGSVTVALDVAVDNNVNVKLDGTSILMLTGSVSGNFTATHHVSHTVTAPAIGTHVLTAEIDNSSGPVGLLVSGTATCLARAVGGIAESPDVSALREPGASHDNNSTLTYLLLGTAAASVLILMGLGARRYRSTLRKP